METASAEVGVDRVTPPPYHRLTLMFCAAVDTCLSTSLTCSQYEVKGDGVGKACECVCKEECDNGATCGPPADLCTGKVRTCIVSRRSVSADELLLARQCSSEATGNTCTPTDCQSFTCTCGADGYTANVDNTECIGKT